MGVAKTTFASAGLISQHSKPGVYSRNESLPRTAGEVSAANLVIMGASLGGKPGEILWFTEDSGAQHILKGGELLNGVLLAFSPGGELRPQKVGALRVNAAVQAVAKLKKGANEIIDLVTADYGNLTNQTQYKLADGTTTGKKFSEKYRDKEYDYDNIKRESFKIQYIGAGTAATMTINGTQVATTVTGGPGGEDLTIAFASFPKISDIVSYINGQAAYTAEYISGQESTASDELDYVTAQDVKTSEYTAVSDVQALMDAINATRYWRASLHTGANRDIPDNVTTFTFGTGGSEGAYTTTEWTAALSYMEDKDVQLVVPMSEDAAIQALLKTHINITNSVTGRSERQGKVGATAQTLAGAKTTAALMNHSAVGVCYKKFKAYNYENVLTDFTSMHFAAQIGGMTAALDLNVPCTNKVLNDVELSYPIAENMNNVGSQEDAIENGVIVAEQDPSGVISVIRDISSYQSNDLKLNENCMVRQMLFMARDLRTGAKAFIGSAGTGIIYEKTKFYAVDKLNIYRGRGYLVGEPGNPAWKNLVLTVDGDAVNIVWTGNVSAPYNFLFITNQFDVFVSA